MYSKLIVRTLLVRINVNSADQRGMHEVSFSDILWVTFHAGGNVSVGDFQA